MLPTYCFRSKKLRYKFLQSLTERFPSFPDEGPGLESLACPSCFASTSSLNQAGRRITPAAILRSFQSSGWPEARIDAWIVEQDEQLSKPEAKRGLKPSMQRPAREAGSRQMLVFGARFGDVNGSSRRCLFAVPENRSLTRQYQYFWSSSGANRIHRILLRNQSRSSLATGAILSV
jgi:hypothetical protein